MRIRDVAIETYLAITVNKARSFLTILGIVIGISSVIAMTAIGRGAQKDIESQIESIGSNLLMITSGAGRGFGPVRSAEGSSDNLDLDDVTAIEQLTESVAAIAPQVSERSQVIAGENNTNTSILGTTSGYMHVKNISLSDGVFLSDVDNLQMLKVAVIGSDVYESLFESAGAPVGQRIKIGTTNFTIIGIAEENGTNDDVIYIPLKTAQQYFSGSNALSEIDVSIKEGYDMTVAEEELSAILRSTHDLADTDEDDFRIRNQEDIVETASSITGTFTMLLGAIAGISLVVGGIGIMNMMLTSVTERTREIGLRKSLGAKVYDIRIQFLAESIVLTLFGGILGVLVGVGVAEIVEVYADITTYVSFSAVWLAFGVSVAIGIIFGFYPAWRASRLDPITALRYE